MSKRFAIAFIALVCLLAFIGIGVLFYANWVVQKPFAIILFLTDNLTPSTLTAARIYKNGADTRLNLEKLPNLGLITTHAADFAVSDSGGRSDRHRHRTEGQQPLGWRRYFREASFELA